MPFLSNIYVRAVLPKIRRKGSAMRTYFEQLESLLSPLATKSSQTQGRAHPLPPCESRTEFQRDRDRIVHCKAFRRLKHKTQVFLSPSGDHYRTRLTHTIEVMQISRTVARALRLNEDLAEAIAWGHDLGHTPFGHAGERALNRLVPGGFRHNEQSLRVADVLENLNLTGEVRNGILCHTGPERPATMEGKVVRLCDKIAYVNHDIDDAVRAGLLQVSDLPAEVNSVMGITSGQRIGTMVADVVSYSEGKGEVSFSPPLSPVFTQLHRFMHANIYNQESAAKKEEAKAEAVLAALYTYYCTRPEELPPEEQSAIGQEGLYRTVCDYVSGMTDNYCMAEYGRLYMPAGWNR